jgi:hypothetical protein
MLAKLHDRAFAETTLDLGYRQFQRFLTIAGTGSIGKGGGCITAVVTAAICGHAVSPIVLVCSGFPQGMAMASW